MWLCYLRFEDQGQVVTYHIRCEAQANIDELVRQSKKHGLTATARLIEHAAFSSMRTIYPRSIPEGHWYDCWEWLERWEVQDSTRQLVLIDRATPPEPGLYGSGRDTRRRYLFPQVLVVCCNNLTLTEVQSQVCECLVRIDTEPPGWVKRSGIGREFIHVRVLQRVRDQIPESTLSALLASLV